VEEVVAVEVMLCSERLRARIESSKLWQEQESRERFRARFDRSWMAQEGISV
jgi:hypothetical protein